MSRYRDQVASALAAVSIRGPTQYEWLGRASRALPAEIDAELDDTARRTYLVSCLREELYASFYCHGRPVPARWGEPEPLTADPWLTTALSRANCGGGSWEAGWTVEHVDGDEAVASRGGLRARVPIADLVPSEPVAPGASTSMRIPSALPEQWPGFYTVVSDAVADLAAEPGIVRVYWNVAGRGAAALVGAMTTRLNRSGVQFRLKVADHPVRFERCDAAVLYLPGHAFAALAATLRDIAAEVRTSLRPPIPAFTLELAPGVGLAEDAGGRESFGVRRCALLADGIVRTHADGLTRPDALLDAVAARFAEDGVLIDAPYLEPSLAGHHVI